MGTNRMSHKRSFVLQVSKKMLIGYARVSKADGSQTVDLQLDELIANGVSK